MARISRKERLRDLRAGLDRPMQEEVPQTQLKIWQTAIYARLSILETRDRWDGEALSNQIALLTSYVRHHPALRLWEIYEDNGETGTHFARAGFQRMMADVRAGHINCIVVKDLSRFGRDYIETGNYLEHVLPFLRVRFISLNDGYDSLNSANGDHWKVAFRNLVNQLYSQDISRKSGAVLRDKQRRGEFIGSFASYGYLRDPEDVHRLAVDPQTAPVVQSLFRRRSKGERIAALTRWLNEERILTPGVYRYQTGMIMDPRFREGNQLWRAQTVSRILSNPVYLGHTVQGQRRSEFYAGRPEHRVHASEWVVVEHTHRPLVNQAVFDQVQAMSRGNGATRHTKLERGAWG